MRVIIGMRGDGKVSKSYKTNKSDKRSARKSDGSKSTAGKGNVSKANLKKNRTEEINRSVYCIFVSPTGNTKEAVRAIAKGIAKKVSDGDFFTIDITPMDEREGVYDFGPEDVVVVGSPTYAGRIPNKLLPYYEEAIIGNGALGVSVVTYGNRAYDDSLKELSNIMLTNDFKVVSAVAVPTEHAFVPELATGRPNDEDLQKLFEIGLDIGSKILKSDTSKEVSMIGRSSEGISSEDDILARIPGRNPDEMQYYVPKKEDGEPAVFLKAMPKTDTSKCDGCGECKYICPMGCFTNSVTEPEGVCIKCQGCVYVCPNGAKYFDNEDFLSHKEYLKKNYADIKREIEVY